MDASRRIGVTGANGKRGRLVLAELLERVSPAEITTVTRGSAARVVTLAKRGPALEVTRRSSKRSEADFAELVGAGTFAALRGGLIELRAKTTARSRKRVG